MATLHADPGEVVDLATWARDMPEERSKTIVKLPQMQLARIVLPAGEPWRSHQVAGPVVIHCLSGRVTCRIMGRRVTLDAGQLVFLTGDEAHDLSAETDARVLLTIVFP